MAKNADLNDAKSAKKDEFYTQLIDIENEVKHYRRHFKGATVLCNCDDPECSNFYFFFRDNFEFLGLKKLISTCYKNTDWSLFSESKEEKAVCCIYTGKKNKPELRILEQGGSFRSEECIEFLKECDIVCTNPPFSKFREFVALLMKHGKKFLVIGHQNAIKYKEIFPRVMNDEIWLGYGFKGGAGYFINKHYKDYAKAGQHKDGMIRVSGVHWFTNMEHDKRNEDIQLYKHYTPEEFPKFDNFDAINVSKTSDIPCDYDGVMAVPITFMDKYNPTQFEILGITQSWFKGQSKLYPKQEQIAPDGTVTIVTKLNDCPAMRISKMLVDKNTYRVGEQLFAASFTRILIRRRKKG